jgi:GAG-pre-integrase domain
LADTATTSHITHYREAFKTYTPMENRLVTGVGGKEAKIAGHRSVELVSTCNSQDFILLLEDVIHVPRTQYNLTLLGCWDVTGGWFIGRKGVITIITKDGQQVAQGTKVKNNPYMMKVSVQKLLPTLTINPAVNPSSFTGCKWAPSWETWHQHFGHIGYSSLRILLDKKLVCGFDVNTQSIKPDCITCTEAKQHVKPFPRVSCRNTKPGELTHIDIWGKYAIRSIHGNKYYLLLLDDAKQYATMNFVKEKSVAVEDIINYLTYLITHGCTPKAIQIYGGGEFVNEKLKSWCASCGITFCITMPCSP